MPVVDMPGSRTVFFPVGLFYAKLIKTVNSMNVELLTIKSQHKPVSARGLKH